MRLRLPVVFFFLVWSQLLNFRAFGAGNSFDYSTYARVLDNYVTEQGFLQYAQLKANRADMDEFLEQLARVSPENFPEIFATRTDQLAYWINAYNAIVIKGILDHYPVESLTEISFLYGFTGSWSSQSGVVSTLWIKSSTAF